MLIIRRGETQIKDTVEIGTGKEVINTERQTDRDRERQRQSSHRESIRCP